MYMYIKYIGYSHFNMLGTKSHDIRSLTKSHDVGSLGTKSHDIGGLETKLHDVPLQVRLSAPLGQPPTVVLSHLQFSPKLPSSTPRPFSWKHDNETQTEIL